MLVLLGETPLSGQYDIVKTELQPNEQYKSVIATLSVTKHSIKCVYVYIVSCLQSHELKTIFV